MVWMYNLTFDERWDEHFNELPPDIKVRVLMEFEIPSIWNEVPGLKKLEQIKNGLPGRHLEHGVPIFVEELGQYRICYLEDATNRIRKIYFVGNHKDYDKWLKGFR